MRITDEVGWNAGWANNEDGYGKAVYEFAQRWAEALEELIKPDATDAEVDTVLADHAKALSFTHAQGITGFMYGAAVSILSFTWQHGDRLRRWHNLDTQIGTEGEAANKSGSTLNPALLSVGKK